MLSAVATLVRNQRPQAEPSSAGRTQNAELFFGQCFQRSRASCGISASAEPRLLGGARRKKHGVISLGRML